MQKKTLAKEKHTSRSSSTPDRRRANTHSAALFALLGTCARKLAFAQTVRACAVGFAARSPRHSQEVPPFALRLVEVCSSISAI
ncbi:MAG: hypothetical protein PUB85_00380 [Clostridia bacterium]|nr:hypothetical protein [Clostridia bacterium]